MIKNCVLLIGILCIPSLAYCFTEEPDTTGMHHGNRTYIHSYATQNKSIDQIHTISLMGIGSGYLAHPDFRKVPLDFYIAHLWEIWKYSAIRLGGEYLTDLNDATVATITTGINIYPFAYGITPYFGIEAGLAYDQIPEDSDFGFAIAVETGVFAIRVANLLLAFSPRFIYNTSLISGHRPIIFLLRVGLLM